MVPSTTAPAFRIRETIIASVMGLCPRFSRLPVSHRCPATAIEAFTDMGSPASNPGLFPERSSAAACARTLSASKSISALSRGLSLSICRMCSSASSRGDILRARSIANISTAERRTTSLIWRCLLRPQQGRTELAHNGTCICGRQFAGLEAIVPFELIGNVFCVVRIMFVARVGIAAHRVKRHCVYRERETPHRSPCLSQIRWHRKNNPESSRLVAKVARPHQIRSPYPPRFRR